MRQGVPVPVTRMLVHPAGRFVAVTLSHIKDGRLRALAVTLPTRSPLLPEVPTTVEAGMPPISVEFFAALFGPAKMPAEIATRRPTTALARRDGRCRRPRW